MDRLNEMGLPLCKPRQTFRTYFRDLMESDPKGWLEKTEQFTGETKETINRALATKRPPKKKKASVAKPRPKPETHPPVQSPDIPIGDIIETMTTPQEASDFVRSSPTISAQFLTFVTNERKKRKQPKR